MGESNARWTQGFEVISVTVRAVATVESNLKEDKVVKVLLDIVAIMSLTDFLPIEEV